MHQQNPVAEDDYDDVDMDAETPLIPTVPHTVSSVRTTSPTPLVVFDGGVAAGLAVQQIAAAPPSNENKEQQEPAAEAKVRECV